MSDDAGTSTSQTAIHGAAIGGETGQNGGFVLRFTRTDAGNPPRRPPNIDPTPVDGVVNYHKATEPNDAKSLLWRKAAGQYIAEQALGRSGEESKEYIIADFPEGYILYNHYKGPAGSPRSDPYLYGSSKVPKFRSSKEFVPHALWLYRSAEAEDEPCQCQYCSGALRDKTNARTKARASGVSPLKPEKPKSSPGGSNAPVKRRGRPSKASALDDSPHPNSSMGPDHSPSPAKKSARPIGGLLRTVEPERHNDLAYWEHRRYRENELVWVLLDPPMQGPEPWQRIELWPGLVKRVSANEEIYRKGAAVPSTYNIMFLAAHQIEQVEVSDIAPFLAYAVPNDFFGWLMCQDLPPAFRNDLHRIDKFRPFASKTVPVTPLAAPPLPTFDDAWPSYVLALTLAGEIFQKWSVSDPYEADREWYLDFRLTPPRRFRKPGEVYNAKFVEFTLLQGMYLGAERIWQNDLVRLNTPWANLQGLSREPTAGSATRGLFYEVRWILRKKVSKDEREIITEGRLYELVPENTPDDIDTIKEEPAPPVAAAAQVIAPVSAAVPAPIPPYAPLAPPTVAEAQDGSMAPAEPDASADIDMDAANHIASTETNGAVVAAHASADTNGTNHVPTTYGATTSAQEGMEVDQAHSVTVPTSVFVEARPPPPGTIEIRSMKRLMLGQPPLRGKDGQPTFDYPHPQAPPGFKFRCLHNPGTVGVTVGPLAIAGRYYRHLLVESSRVHQILGDPVRNGIGSDQLQSLAGSLPGQLCAMMPVDYMYRGRAMMFVESERTAKKTLADRWGVSPDDFMYRFVLKDSVKRTLDEAALG
ncbi:hypothetical protein CALCODRAFT_481699 [Calocera cornea HHB12733]|uniref:Cryptic loci regulator 2 N-terminal domain-containing protein n=1 Tax=Calocera cornea HHB12733 TaxID=1353952 RepID=A0A165HH64_9BASI|nr:hypothetical protein CALCODRAFT_481699 [Calocera cornea HHB12733]